MAGTVARLCDRLSAEVEHAVTRLRDRLPRPVRLAVTGLEQVDHLVAFSLQELRDQAAVAPPPQRLGAHEAGLGLCERRRKGLLPLGRAHAGGIAGEGGAPDAAEPVPPGFPAAPAAELQRVSVVDAGAFDGGGKRRLVELRVPSRARKPAHVDERAHAGLAEHLEELLARPGAVPDGEDAHLRRMPSWRTTSSSSPTSSGRSGRVTKARSRGTPPRSPSPRT